MATATDDLSTAESKQLDHLACEGEIRTQVARNFSRPGKENLELISQVRGGRGCIGETELVSLRADMGLGGLQFGSVQTAATMTMSLLPRPDYPGPPGTRPLIASNYTQSQGVKLP